MYPNWLPYPRYIIKSFLLILEAGVAMAIGQVAMVLMAIPLVFGGGLGIVEAIAALWFLLWVFIAPIWIFAQCDRLLWHKPKHWDRLGWLPHNRSIGEGIFAYFALLVGFGIPGLIVAIVSGDRYVSPRLTDEQLTPLAIVVITIMSYLYHLGGFIFRWQQATFKPKPKAKPHRPTSKVKPTLSKPMTDIDREIEELKRKMEGK